MVGKQVFRWAIDKMPEVAIEAVRKAGLSMQDIDLFIPHQANMRINQMVAARLELPDEKVVHNIEKYGNTTAATIPMALDVAFKDGRVKDGSNLLFAAFGAGYTWAGAVPGFFVAVRRGTLACAALQVSSSRFVAEPSLALLAPLRCSLEGGCGTFRVGDASHPPHPRSGHFAFGGRTTTCLLQPFHGAERSEWRARGTEGPLRVGALDASHPPHPQKRTICATWTLCGWWTQGELLAPVVARSRA
jgi:hypothetical protein